MTKKIRAVAWANEDAAVPSTRSSGRPRSEISKRAVLEVSYAILKDTGIRAFSIEAVALKSGVARTTIYRWWPNKGALAIESFLTDFRPRLAFARTGNAVADFRALVISLATALSGPAGRVAASVMAEAQTDQETQLVFKDQFSGPLRKETTALLRAGIAEKRFRPDLHVASVIDAFVGAIYLRLLFGQSLNTRWAHSLSDTLIEGCSTRSR